MLVFAAASLSALSILAGTQPQEALAFEEFMIRDEEIQNELDLSFSDFSSGDGEIDLDLEELDLDEEYEIYMPYLEEGFSREDIDEFEGILTEDTFDRIYQNVLNGYEDGVELIPCGARMFDASGSGKMFMNWYRVSLTEEKSFLYPQLSESLEELSFEIDSRSKSFLLRVGSAMIDSQESGLTGYELNDMQVIRFDDRLLSLLHSEEGYTGGAHGYYYSVGYNFDPNTGRKLRLRDVIADPDAFVRNISDQVYGYDISLLVDDLDQYLWDLLDAADDSDFCWIADPEGITVMFNIYEIAPYVYGEIDCRINLEDDPGMFAEEYFDLPDWEWSYDPLREVPGSWPEDAWYKITSNYSEGIALHPAPDQYSSVIVRVPKGTKFESRARFGSYVYTTVFGYDGWINTDYAEEVQPYYDPIAEVPGSWETDTWYRITSSYWEGIALHPYPDPYSEVLGRIGKGTQFYAQAQYQNYVYTSVNGISGWINIDYAEEIYEDSIDLDVGY